MGEAISDHRNVRVRMLRPGVAEQGVAVRAPDHEERLAAHERRIHNHPCPCGSGKTYGMCCLSHPNQAQLELRNRRRMGMRDENL